MISEELVQLMNKVANSDSSTKERVLSQMKEAKEHQIAAFTFFLKSSTYIQDVILRCRNQGVSGYCMSSDGAERECFHFAVKKDTLVVYQLANVYDPKCLFSRKEPGKPRAKSADISGRDEEENKYVFAIFEKAVNKLRG